MASGLGETEFCLGQGWRRAMGGTRRTAMKVAGWGAGLVMQVRTGPHRLGCGLCTCSAGLSGEGPAQRAVATEGHLEGSGAPSPCEPVTSMQFKDPRLCPPLPRPSASGRIQPWTAAAVPTASTGAAPAVTAPAVTAPPQVLWLCAERGCSRVTVHGVRAHAAPPPRPHRPGSQQGCDGCVPEPGLALTVHFRKGMRGLA